MLFLNFPQKKAIGLWWKTNVAHYWLNMTILLKTQPFFAIDARTCVLVLIAEAVAKTKFSQPTLVEFITTQAADKDCQTTVWQPAQNGAKYNIVKKSLMIRRIPRDEAPQKVFMIFYGICFHPSVPRVTFQTCQTATHIWHHTPRLLRPQHDQKCFHHRRQLLQRCTKRTFIKPKRHLQHFPAMRSLVYVALDTSGSLLKTPINSQHLFINTIWNTSLTQGISAARITTTMIVCTFFTTWLTWCDIPSFLSQITVQNSFVSNTRRFVLYRRKICNNCCISTAEKQPSWAKNQNNCESSISKHK